MDKEKKNDKVLIHHLLPSVWDARLVQLLRPQTCCLLKVAVSVSD
jgi:hypothetical protein